MTESVGAFEFYLQETWKDLSENGKQIDLKPEQGTAIKSLVHGQDVLAILPTGFDVNKIDRPNTTPTKEDRMQLDKQIESYFKMAASNQHVRERYGAAVLDIPGHETVLRPKETLQRLCDHLEVTCSEDYFEKCSNILFGAPSFTRDTVVWTEEQKEHVTEMMKKYPFMKEYSFDTYPS